MQYFLLCLQVSNIISQIESVMRKVDVQGVYACIDSDITEDPRRQTGAKLNAN